MEPHYRWNIVSTSISILFICFFNVRLSSEKSIKIYNQSIHFLSVPARPVLKSTHHGPAIRPGSRKTASLWMFTHRNSVEKWVIIYECPQTRSFSNTLSHFSGYSWKNDEDQRSHSVKRRMRGRCLYPWRLGIVQFINSLPWWSSRVEVCDRRWSTLFDIIIYYYSVFKYFLSIQEWF